MTHIALTFCLAIGIILSTNVSYFTFIKEFEPWQKRKK